MLEPLVAAFIAELAEVAARDYLAAFDEQRQELAAQCTKPASLPASDQAA